MVNIVFREEFRMRLAVSSGNSNIIWLLILPSKIYCIQYYVCCVGSQRVDQCSFKKGKFQSVSLFYLGRVQDQLHVDSFLRTQNGPCYTACIILHRGSDRVMWFNYKTWLFHPGFNLNLNVIFISASGDWVGWSVSSLIPQIFSARNYKRQQ